MTSKKGFIPTILIVVLALVIAVGGVGIGLAWRTNYLDKYLPARVKELLGKEAKPSDQVSDQEKEPGEEPKPEEEDKTKDWKTYTNTKYEFSVKYPSNWTAESIVVGDMIRVAPGDQALGGVAFNGPGVSAGISLIYEKTKETDPAAYIRSVAAVDLDPEAYPVSVEETTNIGGLNGVIASHISPGMDYAYRAYYAAVIKEGIAYSIEVSIGVVEDGYQPLNDTWKALLATFNAMVPSFRFLD